MVNRTLPLEAQGDSQAGIVFPYGPQENQSPQSFGGGPSQTQAPSLPGTGHILSILSWEEFPCFPETLLSLLRQGMIGGKAKASACAICQPLECLKWKLPSRIRLLVTRGL